ncbi:putative Transcriptional regulator, MarR family protein [uncultured spirochete]|jgi:DNA-binding MarR family transcriptional regulator|uniref:Putative Transcriptional regulator, MarR family protein n=1 Tax=uncultured spirochete TaxID=156406 RepID=A0A3P3XF98_9SPIR|nr:MarR family transcriptional regulator [Rectinema subterraneum]SLM09752.1 putative Transcriptional regulator, MarR family protein [uncultured spirochete]
MSEHSELENALKAWISQIMRLSMRGFITFATEIGLSMPQIAVLFRLNGDKRCAVTELGDELGVSGAAASQMVDKLVQLGLVDRLEDPHDRRVRRLLLTQKGKTIIERSIEARQEWIGHFCSSLSEEKAKEAAGLFNQFAQIAEQLETALHTPSSH